MRLLIPAPERTLAGATDLEEVYATPDRPAVRANFVLSLDGVTEIGGKSGPLGGRLDRKIFATLRALSDVIVVGAGTVRAENYGPAKVGADASSRRKSRGQAPIPAIAVVTSRAGLRPNSRFFTGDGVAGLASGEGVEGVHPPRALVLTCEAAPAENREALAEVADVVICGTDEVDFRAALAALRTRGLAQVLCEGGPSLFSSLAGGGLIDELCLTSAPVLAGPSRLTLTVGQPWSDPRRWLLATLLEGDGQLFARYVAEAR